jgi:uncharacterized membrane protein
LPYSLLAADPADANARAATFDVKITPRDPLGRDGVILLAKYVVVAAIILFGLFIARAYWLAVAAVAFDACFLLWVYRLVHNRDVHERILVSDGAVVVIQRREGRTARRELRVFGLSLERLDDAKRGCLSLALTLRGERIEIARDLTPGERESFCALLEPALQNAGAKCPVVRRPASKRLAQSDSLT